MKSESGGNPNYSDYMGFKKPRFRLYFNRMTGNTWWCFIITPREGNFIHMREDFRGSINA